MRLTILADTEYPSSSRDEMRERLETARKGHDRPWLGQINTYLVLFSAGDEADLTDPAFGSPLEPGQAPTDWLAEQGGNLRTIGRATTTAEAMAALEDDGCWD